MTDGKYYNVEYRSPGAANWTKVYGELRPLSGCRSYIKDFRRAYACIYESRIVEHIHDDVYDVVPEN